ncbi:hypothetical protein ACXYTP_23605 [Tsukamurella ocularis]
MNESRIVETAVFAIIVLAAVYLFAQVLRAYPSVVGVAIVVAAIAFGAWGMTVHTPRRGPRDRSRR